MLDAASRKPTVTLPPTNRTYRRMARARFARMLRLMKYAREANLRVLYLCRNCQQPVSLERGAGLLVTGPVTSGINAKADPFTLTCRCTVWMVGQ